MDNDALLGYSGFVGSSLLRQRSFEHQFRSTNITDIHAREFDLAICAAAPAQKWLANKEPDKDQANMQGLISHLGKMHCKQFVLISTVDVFADPENVDESTPTTMDGLHPYGQNRLHLERFVRERFPEALIIRLPGLVGPGLRKNIIYDFLNDNNLSAIDSRHRFQFYPMVNLWSDIQLLLKQSEPLVHLTAEPVSVEEVATEGFNLHFRREVAETPISYNFRTRFSSFWGQKTDYQYSKKESLLAIRAYAQSEPKTPKN